MSETALQETDILLLLLNRVGTLLPNLKYSPETYKYYSIIEGNSFLTISNKYSVQKQIKFVQTQEYFGLQKPITSSYNKI